MKKQEIFDQPLFALGFRAFFYLAGLSALALIALWRTIYNGAFPIDNYYPANYWHAHEMLLGYTAAVIAGFLLTAVKNWTGQATVSGDGLAGLCLLWLYGRIVPFYSGLIPDSVIALLDFAFLPALAYQVFKPVMRAGHYQSFMFVAFILLMAFGNALIHLQILGMAENSARWGIQLTLAVIVLLILVIAGRVFPFFTERALSGTLALRSPLLDGLSILSATVVFILDLLSVSPLWLAMAAILAVICNSLRVVNWLDQRVWYVPLLWILYTGYGWIILGFALLALSSYNVVLPSLALHAFTIGGIGVLTLGMMARVSLGHTGRALRVSGFIALAFVLINLAVFFRIFLPVAYPGWYSNAVYISTGLWLAAFSLFVFIYAPILMQPRADGKPG